MPWRARSLSPICAARRPTKPPPPCLPPLPAKGREGSNLPPPARPLPMGNGMIYRLTFATLFCASCAATPVVETRVVVPVVPVDLLAPVTVPDRAVDPLADVGLILTDHVEALATANDHLAAVACILARAAAQADGSPMPDCKPQKEI